MRFFISLSYNGAAFCGWQRQNNGPSVQEHLESAFSVYLREKIEITGAGRTDTGVHAVNYIAHFDSGNTSLAKEQQLLLYKINAILPTGIVVTDICAVSPDAHARFDALSRTYNYYVHTVKDPFLTDFSYFFPYDLDIESMNRAAALLIGEMDFTSMAKLHSDVKTNICTVTEALWTPGSPMNNITPAGLANSYCFTITANRFLRNMVRAIVGSLLEVGRGRRQPEWITQLLAQKDRSAAGNSVPAHPLYLTKIEYPYPLFSKTQ